MPDHTDLPLAADYGQLTANFSGKLNRLPQISKLAANLQQIFYFRTGRYNICHIMLFGT